MRSETRAAQQTATVFHTENLNVYYGNFLALKNINIDIPKNKITAFIGPSERPNQELSRRRKGALLRSRSLRR